MQSIVKIVAIVTIMFISGFLAIHTVFAEEQVIIGIVVQTDQGVVISADDCDYIVEGQDLFDMIGKNVKAAGTIEESEVLKIITVTSVEEVAPAQDKEGETPSAQ
ncbi:MAG: hypothetical protein GY874_06735 [Desulfobacteraceae bacterium]|nr:hypothetical protein [Desulfobacteraceae bacterium]